MIEKLLNELLARKQKYSEEILLQPPATMEALKYRVGRYHECIELIDMVEKIARGNEDE